MRLLSKICKAHRIIPTSYVLRRDLIRVGAVCCHSGFADVSDGEYLGFSVAIKRLRMNEGDSDRCFKVPPTNCTQCHRSAFTQRLCREIIHWRHLSHPNILPLLGVSVSADQRYSILTMWMPGGNVMEYATSNTDANRLRLVTPFAVSPSFSFSFTL